MSTCLSPAAPYEAAMLLAADARKRGRHDGVTVNLYTPEPGPMPVAGPQVSALVRQMVESRGVRIHTAPAPRRRLRGPGRLLHLGKVAYEKYWLSRWF